MPAENGRVARRHLHAARNILTTGDVSRLCGVAARTVTNWCNSGDLPSYRVNSDRRIEATDLRDFLRSRRMPVPPELHPPVALFAGLPAPLLCDVATPFEDSGYESRVVPDWVRLGYEAHCSRPDVIVAHSSLGYRPRVARFLRDEAGVAYLYWLLSDDVPTDAFMAAEGWSCVWVPFDVPEIPA